MDTPNGGRLLRQARDRGGLPSWPSEPVPGERRLTPRVPALRAAPREMAPWSPRKRHCQNLAQILHRWPMLEDLGPRGARSIRRDRPGRGPRDALTGPGASQAAPDRWRPSHDGSPPSTHKAMTAAWPYLGVHTDSAEGEPYDMRGAVAVCSFATRVASTGLRFSSVFSVLNQNGAPRLSRMALASTPTRWIQLGFQY